MRYFVALGLALLLVGQSTVSWGAPVNEEGTAKQVAYGAGSALGTLVYSPFKASFCILGAIGSGFAFPFGAKRAERVIGASCRGTWVITPDVVKGREPIEFIGNSPTDAAAVNKR